MISPEMMRVDMKNCLARRLGLILLEMAERFIPEVPLAVHIELKRKSKTDRRAFTIETDDTYDYEKFIMRLCAKFKLQEPFNEHYVLRYKAGKRSPMRRITGQFSQAFFQFY